MDHAYDMEYHGNRMAVEYERAQQQKEQHEEAMRQQNELHVSRMLTEFEKRQPFLLYGGTVQPYNIGGPHKFSATAHHVVAFGETPAEAIKNFNVEWGRK